MSVVIETSFGDIVIDLYTKKAPLSSLNFLKLCKVKYYKGHVIHTVESDTLIQTGDPTATGHGGQSIFGLLNGPSKRFFKDEIADDLRHNKIGTVSMANAGKNANGSQFFITTTERHLDYFDGKYTIFGHVEEGLDVLLKINDVLCDDKNRPYQDILINDTIVLDDPFEDPEGIVVPDDASVIPDEVLRSYRISVNENIFPENEIPIEALEAERKQREAAARALTLEMVGDLPSADIKPLENILFVCKLNPVTVEEDLELIFSRFGAIKSLEIIRNSKTGDSLQYAFIEFEEKDSCEEAYFKMDNVLIDDRRIHVDFSQSVSKLHKEWYNNRIEKLGGDSKAPAYSSLKDMDLKTKSNAKVDSKYDLVFDAEAPKGAHDSKDLSYVKLSHYHSRSSEKSRFSKPKDSRIESDSRRLPSHGHRSGSRNRDRKRSRSRDNRRDVPVGRDRRRDRSKSRDSRRDRSKSPDRFSVRHYNEKSRRH